MVHTRIEIPDNVWTIVKLKASKEDKDKHEALEEILREYIKNHEQEYGYSIPE